MPNSLKSFLAALGLWAIAVSAQAQTAQTPAPVNSNTWELFNEALKEAAILDPRNAKTLKRVSQKEALMVLWVPRARLGTGETEIKEETRIYLASELADQCKYFSPNRLDQQLQQLLGLPPVQMDMRSSRFVLLRAHTDDVFRPCTDPDPKTLGPCKGQFPANVTPEHVRWFADQMLTSYRSPEGRTWTRLGYTYNWTPGAKSHYGVSEFVLRGASKVCVEGILPSESFCNENLDLTDVAATGACPSFAASGK
jgi:hypothetical protein